MNVIAIVKNETTPKVTEGEVMFTLSSSDSHRGGGMAIVIRTERGHRESKLGWLADSTNADTAQCERLAEDAR